MILAILILIAALADAVTMLLLPAGSERNPIAASLPVVAIGLKLTVAMALATLVLQRRPYFRAVALIGTAVWLVGTVANVSVLL